MPTGFPDAPELPSQWAAQIGAEPLTLETVTAVAEARGASMEEALQLLLREALWAAHAKGDQSVAERLRRATLARTLLEHIKRGAQQQGAPSDAEVQEASERVWWQVDRPPMRRTSHAVVLVKDPNAKGEARHLAELLHAAVRVDRDAGSFEQHADQFKQLHTESPPEIRVEQLPPVTEAGLSVVLEDPAPKVSAFDGDYVRATYAIQEVGDQSPIVETRFGFHVILLTELIAEHRLSLDQRRERFAKQIMSQRAQQRVQSLRAQLRSVAEIHVTPNWDALTELPRLER